MLKQYPFGVCFKINENGRSFGTIALLSSTTDVRQISLIGYQRFEVLELESLHRRTMAYIVARVKIIKDTTLYYPLNNKLFLDPNKHCLGHRRICSKKDIMFHTQWPSWIYKHFDVYELASHVSKKVKMLCRNIRISDDPIFLSFQVTKLGIFSESANFLVFSQQTYDFNNVMEKYICASSHCRARICNSKQFRVNSTHLSNCRYWNTSRNMITVCNLDDDENIIRSVNTECKCIPGYKGICIYCKTCYTHWGWMFLADGSRSLTPTSFYGLNITALTKTLVKIDP